MSKIYLAEKSLLDSIGGSFCTCSTAAAAAAKTAALSGFALKTGAQAAVKFTDGNTALNPTLNINGTGAKPIYYHNAAVPAAMLMSGGVYLFVYDGSRWQLMGNHFAAASNRDELGSTQFYSGLKSMHYSGGELVFPSGYESSKMYFSTPATSTNNWSQTFCYGRINFGEFVKQGYKRLFMSCCKEGAYDAADVCMYISSTSSTSGSVASASASFDASSTWESKFFLLDISNLTGSYYFIITVQDTTAYHSFHIKAENVYLLT